MVPYVYPPDDGSVRAETRRGYGNVKYKKYF